MHANPSSTEMQRAAGPADAEPCVLCGGASFARQFPGAPAPTNGAGPHVPYRITHSERRLLHAIVRCTSCGLVTLPPSGRGAASYEDAEDPYYVEQADERIENAGRLLDLVPARGRLLEIGPACGFLLLAARRRGFEVAGVEMSAWASDFARREYGLDVHTGRLEDLALAAGSFDVVVMADVIEHLTDPRQTLGEVRRVLAPGGQLLLLTPDIGSATARAVGTRWWALLDDHYFYFSRDTLTRLLESEGFRVERITALGRRFRVGHWVFKLKQYNGALHGAATRVARTLGIESMQVPLNLGDQMACVARKT